MIGMVTIVAIVACVWVPSYFDTMVSAFLSIWASAQV